MAKRSPAEIIELKETSELSCTWGLLSIHESRQGRTKHKLISNGRPVKEHIMDYPRKLQQLASFDEQCRKFQNESDLASVSVDAIAKTIQEDMLFTKHRERKNLVKEQQHRETDSGLVDSVVKNQKRRRKKSQNVYQPPHHLNDSMIPQLTTSTSVQVPVNKLTVAAILGEVGDEINTQQVQISGKAFADEMFIERKFIHKEGLTSEFKPFSNSLEVLNSNKHFFMKPNSQPANDIVIMKPVVPRSAKYSENVTCYCSSMQSHPVLLSERVLSEKTKPTSFSFREMKRKLKHTFKGFRNEPNKVLVDCTLQKLPRNRPTKIGGGCIYRGVDTRESFSSSTGIACGTDNAREKLDLSRQDFDVILEAKKHLSARIKILNEVDIPTSKKSPRTLERILSSPEQDCWALSPRRDWYGSPSSTKSSYEIPNGRQRTSPNSQRSIKEVLSFGDHKEDGNELEIFGTRRVSSLFQSIDEAAHDPINSPTDKLNSSNGESEIVETKSSHLTELYSTEVPFGGTMHSPLDPISANETITSTLDDFESPSSSICQLDGADSTKDQEEHRSPVSVLEPFFTEDENSPPSTTPQTGQFAERQSLKPQRLDFDECLYEDQPISQTPCINEEDYIFLYVHLILEASHLNWDQLSEIRSQSEEILHESLFEEVGFLRDDSLFDYKLLFDHINEVLIQIYESHCCSPWIRSIKPEIRSSPLENIVLDEILKEAEFYLFPQTDKRTLDQLVSKDVACSRSWINVGQETERIVFDISEDVMEDSILDLLLDFLT